MNSILLDKCYAEKAQVFWGQSLRITIWIMKTEKKKSPLDLNVQSSLLLFQHFHKATAFLDFLFKLSLGCLFFKRI